MPKPPKKKDEHRCPHVILRQCISERIHLATIPMNSFEERKKHDENHKSCDQHIPEIHIILINGIGEPPCYEIMHKRIDSYTWNNVFKLMNINGEYTIYSDRCYDGKF
jgi:hypothetical protein